MANNGLIVEACGEDKADEQDHALRSGPTAGLRVASHEVY